MATPGTPKPAPQGSWLALVYYYIATTIGLAVLIGGLIGGLHGLVTTALPQFSDEVRYNSYVATAPDGSKTEVTPQDEEQARADARERARIGGLADALYGGVAVIVGGPVFFWHLRQARRREPGLLAPTTRS